MTIYLLIFLIVIVVPIGTIAHELGHGLVAYFVKADAVTLHIGIGKHIKSYVFKRFTIYLYGIFFIGGLTKSQRKPSYNTKEKIWIALGGPAGNAILIILFLITFYPTHNPYIRLFLLFQAWLMLINIIPFKWRGKKSDGYTIIQILWRKITNNTTTNK